MLQSAVGLFGLVAVAWLLSENRRCVSLRVVAVGLALQGAVALLMLKVPLFSGAMMRLNGVVDALQSATRAGMSFVFGYLGGGVLPFAETAPGGAWIMAFQALPLLLVMSALSALLFYWRVIPAVVKGFSAVLQRTMDVGGALGVGVSANIFVGMVEAPLIVKPYLHRLTRSELFTLMTCGMATIAGTVMVVYAAILNPVLPGAIGHILTASIISAPASILIARVMVPETAVAENADAAIVSPATSSMDAITKGAEEGVKLYLNVVAMLVVLVALVSLANQILALLPEVAGAPVSLQRIFALAMWPVVWLVGIPPAEAMTAASLMGTKTVLNEFLGYLQMAALPKGALSPRSMLIMTYAMCGFANFGSLGIMIGGLSAMAPERKAEIVALGFKSIVAGTLATCMTGAVVGVLY
ncbi:NupC/NupG family nucleoside CNT transporter [Oleispirillum naphthae]|uniref:NupC/NupG family nucleoside CNT transporter n=1 Tax=Oleispirillum naphthae TaxID=2838853 RepID=UPI0030825AC3